MNTSRTCPQCGKPLAPNGLQGLCPECMMKVGLETEGGEPKPPPNPPPSCAELAGLFPQLEILECLGWGGMGAVYKARQIRLDRLVALKIIIPQHADQARDAHFAERFEREARALAKLNHPNIVAVYDFGEAGNLPYLVMEYVDGLSLRQLERASKLSPAEALRIVPQVCEALQFAHEAGIVHRDIKPENILLDQKGRVKIADFGIAKILAGDQGRPTLTQQQVLGTPHYMAPEQVEHPQQVDRRADIYSLGVVFYEMLTGELPLGKFAPPSRKVQVDVRLDEVVLHALEKEPERRYQQASEVKTDVEQIAGGAAPANAPSVLAAKPQELGAVAGQRRTMLWYGFVVSLIGLPVGLLMKLPAVWGLSICGIIIGALKLSLLTRESFFSSGDKTRVGESAPAERAGGRSASVLRHESLWSIALFLLPPILLTGFVLFGYRWLGVDLDADVQALTGLLGLPITAGLGALLAWAASSLKNAKEGVPNSGARWSWLALGAAAVLAVSLPLGGGGMVLVQLVGRDGSWNPARGELLITGLLVGGGLLCSIAATFMGWQSLRRIARGPIG